MDEQTVADLKQAIYLSEIDDRGTRKVPAADLLAELTELGYALVKLPATVVDGVGQSYWPVDSRDAHARVSLRRSDGRLVMDSVSNPIDTAQHARSLAAGLLAAAQYIKDENQ